MRVFIAAEESGVVREAFRARGHDAWSGDLAPAADGSAYHLQGDARAHLDRGWDLLIAHPPCTYLCNSGVWAYHRTPPNPSPGVLYGAARWAALEDAIALFLAFWQAPIPKVAIENPVMHKYARERIGRAAQTIQPYQFGDDASKRTALHLRGLPLLQAYPQRFVPPRLVDGKPRWGNQTDSGQNKLGPSAERARMRARTYDGIARAMAEQWGRA